MSATREVRDVRDGEPLAALAGDLQVRRPRALRGPNLWAREPVIQAEVEIGALARHRPEDARGALTRLREALPSLGDATFDVPSVDPTRTHDTGAWWGTLVALVATEIQRLATGTAGMGRVVLSTPDGTRVNVVITYAEEEVAITALRGAGRLVRDVLRADAPDVTSLLERLRAIDVEVRPDAATRAIIAEATRRGIPVRRSIDSDVVQLGLGRHQRRVRGGLTERTSLLAAGIAADPHRVRRVLVGVGVPVAAHEMARGVEEALDAARHLGYPVRLEWTEGASAASPDLPDDDAVRAAWRTREADAECIVERVPTGAGVSVLVVDGRVVGDDTAALHPELRAACELAAMAVGLDIASVAVVAPDLSLPLKVSGAVVTAVDVAPPGVVGRPASAAAVVDMLFPDDATGVMPIVTITGTNGKTTTTRLIAHLVRESGRTVGFTTTDGVYLRETLLMHGDLTGPFAANIILSHREVEFAVLETARGGILKSGLGFPSCDVAVVLNVTPDHLGLRGIDTVEQLAAVKAVLPGVVTPAGLAVLNADDPLVYAMREATPGRVALFSVCAAGARALVDAHVREGGMAAVLDVVDGREQLRIVDGGRVIELGGSPDIPLTFGGLARFQVQNILAASLAAYDSGVTPEDIRRGLRSFLPSSAVTPGRLNLVETPRGQVLLDYAHNAAAVAGLLDFVRAMPARRRMALLSAPGDRRDEDLRAIGALASGLDFVIMKEHDVYRRGRAPGVIAELMADGLRATGYPPERVRTFAEEHEAVSHVMSVMEAGDVVIIIADDTRAVAAQLAAM